jgi:glycyl-tRNA synthetase
VVEIEGAIFLHPRVWEASGHVGGFSDLLVEDVVTHKRYRADHLIEEAGVMPNAGALSPEEVDRVIAEHGLKSPDGNRLSGAKKFSLDDGAAAHDVSPFSAVHQRLMSTKYTAAC